MSYYNSLEYWEKYEAAQKAAKAAKAAQKQKGQRHFFTNMGNNKGSGKSSPNKPPKSHKSILQYGPPVNKSNKNSGKNNNSNVDISKKDKYTLSRAIQSAINKGGTRQAQIEIGIPPDGNYSDALIDEVKDMAIDALKDSPLDHDVTIDFEGYKPKAVEPEPEPKPQVPKVERVPNPQTGDSSGPFDFIFNWFKLVGDVTQSTTVSVLDEMHGDSISQIYGEEWSQNAYDNISNGNSAEGAIETGKIARDYLANNDIAIDGSLTVGSSKYGKFGVTKIVSVRNNEFPTYIHSGLGCFPGFSLPINPSLSIMTIDNYTGKDDYSKWFLNYGGVAGIGREKSFWKGDGPVANFDVWKEGVSTDEFTVSPSFGIQVGLDYYWLLDD